MTPNDYPQFVTLWTQICELYGKPPSDGVLDLIFNALKRFELDAIKQALTAHVNDTKHGDFVPKPADIVRQIEGADDVRALVAWTQVDRAIRGVGHWQTVVFDDPRIMVVIEEMGGWMGLCEILEKEVPFKKNEFVKRYQSYISRPPETFPSKLIGQAEAHNAGEYDEHVPEPCLIGDPQKCLAVMKQGSESRPGITRLSDALDGATQRLTSKSEVA